MPDVFLCATTPYVTEDFLKAFYSRYGYFKKLLILAFKRQDHPVPFPISPTFQKFRKLRFYNILSLDVANHLTPATHQTFTSDDIDYI